jgi:hypothetical protein
MHSNKRGQVNAPADWFMFAIVFAITITLIALAFIITVNNSVSYRISTPYELEEYILVNKFVSGPCFAHFDSLAGSYESLSIDKEKFSNKTLEECYPAKEKLYYPIRLSLVTKEGEIQIVSSNWDKELGAQRKLKPYDVSLYSANGKKYAKIIVELQKK